MAASLTSTGLIAYQSFSPFQQEAVAAAVNDYNNGRNAKTKYGTKTYKVTTKASGSTVSYDVPDGLVIMTPVIGTFINGGSGSITSVSINGKKIDNNQTTYKVTSDTLIEITQSDDEAPAAPADVIAKFNKIKITSQDKPLVFKDANGYRDTDYITRAGLQNLKIDTGDTNAIVRTRYMAIDPILGAPTNGPDDAESVVYTVSIDGYFTEFIIRTKDKPITDWTEANKTLNEATKVYKAGKPADVSDADWKSFTDAYNDFSSGMSSTNPFHDYLPQWMIDVETGKMQAALDKIQKNNGSDNGNTDKPGDNNGGSDNNNGSNNDNNNKPTTVDKTELNQLIADSKAIYDEGGDAYTEDSWLAFTTAYTDAEKVNASMTTTEAQVKAAYDSLKAAKDGLVKNDAGNNDDNNNGSKTPTTDELEVLKNLKAYYRTETNVLQGVRHEIPNFDGTKSATYQVEAGYKGSVYPHVDIDGIPQNWERTYEYDYRNHNSNPEAGVVLIDTVTTPSGAVLKYTFVLKKTPDNTQNPDDNQNNNENNSQNNTNNNANNNQNTTDSDDVNDNNANNNAGNDSTENNTSTNSNNNTASNNANALNANTNANNTKANSNTQVNSKTTDSSGNLAKTGATAGLIGSISVFLMSAGIMVSRVMRRKTK